MFSDKGGIIGYENSLFKYNLCTDKGVSGAGIITDWKG